MHIGRLALASVASLSASAQDVIHYKFDGRCGDRVVNYADPSPAPREGAITVTAPHNPWAPGLWGGAFDGNTDLFTNALIDTGWPIAGVNGSFSYAAWVRLPGPTGIGLPHTLLTATGSGFVAATATGVFEGHMLNQWTTASGGQGLSLTAADIKALARQRWVHIAFVIDVAANRFTAYVDGQVDHSNALAGAVPGNWSGNLRVGPALGSSFLLEELVVATRAFTPGEVTGLFTGPRAAAGRYGAGGCGGAVLSTGGGPPRVPNASFRLLLNDGQGLAGIYSISVASNRCRFGALTIPFNLGLISPQLAGCIADAPNDLGAIGGGYSGGVAQAALPIPGAAVFIGFPVYVQAALLETPSGVIRISNATALGLGL